MAIAIKNQFIRSQIAPNILYYRLQYKPQQS